MPNEEFTFESIPGEMNDPEEPDRRTRPHRAPETVLTCPNCEEETFTKQPYAKELWSCPCGYTEQR